MAKLETISCATTWALMNALLIAAALEFAGSLDPHQAARIARPVVAAAAAA